METPVPKTPWDETPTHPYKIKREKKIIIVFFMNLILKCFDK